MRLFRLRSSHPQKPKHRVPLKKIEEALQITFPQLKKLSETGDFLFKEMIGTIGKELLKC
jgi:hypothetical protein